MCSLKTDRSPSSSQGTTSSQGGVETQAGYRSPWSHQRHQSKKCSFSTTGGLSDIPGTTPVGVNSALISGRPSPHGTAQALFAPTSGVLWLVPEEWETESMRCKSHLGHSADIWRWPRVNQDVFFLLNRFLCFLCLWFGQMPFLKNPFSSIVLCLKWNQMRLILSHSCITGISVDVVAH